MDELDEHSIVYHVKAGQTLNKSISIKGEYYSPLEKKNISIKPKLNSIETNMEIVKKYYKSDLEQTIDADKGYFDKTYNYFLELK